MEKYKVIALSVGGLNKVYNAGDLVTEQNFPEGNVSKLVKEGFLKKASKEDLEKESKASEEVAAAKKAEEEAQKAKEAEEVAAAKKAEEEAQKKAAGQNKK